MWQLRAFLGKLPLGSLQDFTSIDEAVSVALWYSGVALELLTGQTSACLTSFGWYEAKDNLSNMLRGADRAGFTLFIFCTGRPEILGTMRPLAAAEFIWCTVWFCAVPLGMFWLTFCRFTIHFSASFHFEEACLEKYPTPVFCVDVFSPPWNSKLLVLALSSPLSHSVLSSSTGLTGCIMLELLLVAGWGTELLEVLWTLLTSNAESFSTASVLLIAEGRLVPPELSETVCKTRRMCYWL